MNEIDTSIIPTELDKEEARKQFEHHTKVLGLKHTFTFDEAWESLIENRIKKQGFRNDIVRFEEHMKTLPGFLGADPFPLEHTFAGGMYVRKLIVPAKTLTVTKIHKQEHVFFLMKGTISVLTEEGVKKFTAPYQGVTKVGTKRIIYHHDEVIFVTVHATKETEVEKVEEQVIAKDFSEIENKLESEMIKNFIDTLKEE